MRLGDTPPADAVLSSIEWDDANNPNLIDGTTSPRDFIRILGNQFPIWKPSDGDGDDLGTGDVFGAQLPPLDQRWKVFQVRSPHFHLHLARSSHLRSDISSRDVAISLCLRNDHGKGFGHVAVA